MIVRTTRLLVRATAAASTSMGALVLVSLINLLYRRRRARGLALRRRVYRAWARGMCRACAIGVRRTGNPPAGATVLVSNHLSYLDILVIATHYPARFVAKSEVDGWPMIGAMCRSVDTIFVDRSSKRDVLRVSELIAGALGEGDGVVLFPEGTSSRGREVAPFKTSLLEVAADPTIPVCCATISFATPPGEPAPDLAVAWWGDAPFGEHAQRLLRIERIEATVHFAEAPARHRDRKLLGEELHRTVAASFVPLRSDRPAPVAVAPPLTTAP